MEVVNIVCRIVGVWVGPRGEGDIQPCTSSLQNIEIFFDILKAHFSILKRMVLYTFQIKVLINVVVAVTYITILCKKYKGIGHLRNTTMMI